MAKRRGVTTVRSNGTVVRVLGAPRHSLRDAYHAFLRAPFWITLLFIVVGFLALNAIYALVYMRVGGISNARHGSFADAFFFSVQTMGTIGYGAMAPTSTTANLMVVSEAILGIMVTALCTGLVFAKFSQSAARINFTTEAVITPMQGVPTLMFRLGNDRSNLIMEAQLRLVFVRTEKTVEGGTFYRMYDLKPVRDRSPAFTRSWTAMHTIDESSLLFGYTPERMAAEEVELIVSVAGVDDTSLQPVHARKTYLAKEILWGHRHADILTEDSDGSMTLDLGRFHHTERAKRTESFPYGE